MNLAARMDDVSIRFRQQQALDHLRLAVPEGSAYALLGANGAGKTTALKILLDMLRPTAGAAFVLGRDTRRIDAAHLAQIGYVAENQRLPARQRVGAFLQYVRDFYPTWDRELERSTVRLLGLPLERRIGDLSHGQRIKVALAAALPFRPRLLLLDEPFSGLDPLVRDELMEGLLAQAGDMSIVVASQEVGEIEHLTTHIGFLDQGRLLFEEPLDTLQARMREVRVVLQSATPLPAGWPPEWLQPKMFGNVLTYIDARYDESSLRARLATLLGTPRQVDTAAVSLRVTFTALVRAARQGVSP